MEESKWFWECPLCHHYYDRPGECVVCGAITYPKLLPSPLAVFALKLAREIVKNPHAFNACLDLAKKILR